MSLDLDPGLARAAAETPPVERQLTADMVRRSLPAFPVLIAVGAIVWGTAGALSVAFAIVLVVLNFALSAALLGWAARISLSLLMAVALSSFLIRLGLITAVVLLVKDQSWVELVPLGFTLIITHLGVLVWETRHVSASLAFPALKPKG